jgi:hypothetical protein
LRPGFITLLPMMMGPITEQIVPTVGGVKFMSGTAGSWGWPAPSVEPALAAATGPARARTLAAAVAAVSFRMDMARLLRRYGVIRERF